MLKKFVIRTLLFAFIIAASVSVCEICVRSLPNPYKTKQEAMERMAPTVRTLILGNSHTYFGVRPDMLGPGAVNLANVSQTLRYDRRLLEQWLPRTDSLKTVIMHVGLTSLFDIDMEDTSDWIFAINYQIYNRMGVHPLLSKYSLELSNISTWNGKLGVFFGLRESNLQCDSLGHGESYPVSAKYAEWEETGPDFARRHTENLHRDMVEANLDEIARVDSLCRSRGARLVLVTLPEWHTYRENVTPADYRRFTAAIDSFSRARDIPWISYWDDPRFGADDFYDADHLTSDAGATKMTRILRHDLRQILR